MNATGVDVETTRPTRRVFIAVVVGVLLMATLVVVALRARPHATPFRTHGWHVVGRGDTGGVHWRASIAEDAHTGALLRITGNNGAQNAIGATSLSEGELLGGFGDMQTSAADAVLSGVADRHVERVVYSSPDGWSKEMALVRVDNVAFYFGSAELHKSFTLNAYDVWGRRVDTMRCPADGTGCDSSADGALH